MKILFTQERFEAVHKIIRKYRAGRARHEDYKSKVDIMHALMLDSDPHLRTYQKDDDDKVEVPASTATNEDEVIIRSMFL